MHTIQLSQGKVALLDDDDFARFSQFHWCYRGERNGALGYAIRHAKEGKYKYRTEYLHRAIMNPPPDHEVIFLNHDRLDCRRANLRVVTKEEARQHHRVRRDSKSGLKGVGYEPEIDRWTAQMYRGGHCYGLGIYRSQEEAMAAYEAALRRENPDLHGAPRTVERHAVPTDVQRDEKTRPK